MILLIKESQRGKLRPQEVWGLFRQQQPGLEFGAPSFLGCSVLCFIWELNQVYVRIQALTEISMKHRDRR